MGLRRLRGRLDQVQGHANQTMFEARDAIAVGKALAEDVQDGIATKILPLPGFSKFMNRLLKSFAAYLGAELVYRLKGVIPLTKQEGPPPEIDLTWMERSEIPVAITIDPDYDVFPVPGQQQKLHGGPLDGMVATPKQEGRKFLMNDEHYYTWDGHRLNYLESKTA